MHNLLPNMCDEDKETHAKLMQKGMSAKILFPHAFSQMRLAETRQSSHATLNTNNSDWQICYWIIRKFS